MTDKNEIKESEEIEKDQHKNEKEVGVEIEHEHKPTVNKIKEYLEERGCLPPDDFIYVWITEDHMNEFKKYYDNNVGLPEMERRLSVDKENKVYDKIEESLKSFYIDKQYEITQLKNLEMKDKINSRIKFNTYKELINGHLIKKLNPSTSKQEWCLVSKKDNSKILKWFGSSKPSNEEVSKEEKRINYFKNVASINAYKSKLEEIDNEVYKQIGDFEWHLVEYEDGVYLSSPDDTSVGMYPSEIASFKSIEEFIEKWKECYPQIEKLADIAQVDDNWEKFDNEVGKLLNPLKASIESAKSEFAKTQDGWVVRILNKHQDHDFSNVYTVKHVDGPKVGKEEDIEVKDLEIIKSSDKKKVNALDVESFEKVKDYDGKEYIVLSTDDNEVTLSDEPTGDTKIVPKSDFDWMYTKASLYDEKLKSALSEEDFQNRFNNLLSLVSQNKTVKIKLSNNNTYEVIQTINTAKNKYIKVRNIATNKESSMGSNELKKGFIILDNKEKVAANSSLNIMGDFENKKAYLERTLVKKYKTPEEIQEVFNYIKNADPSGNKANYAVWICNMLVKDIIKFPEDIDKVKEKLALFDKIKNKVDIQKDINQYKSFGELSELLEPYKEVEKIPETKGETERREIEEGQKVLHDDGTYKIIQVSNPAACAVLFRGTDWCVKNPKWSTDYLKQADLFYFMKNNKPYALFHKPSAQFFNVHDTPLKSKVVKELYPFVKKYLNCIMLEYEDEEIEIV